ncbi:MAG: adenylate cyclase [Planctomycetota bacterium]|nr:MAG: adenylate cyclase [Planctomycetota bacterium]
MSANPPLEIERVYLLRTVPELPAHARPVRIEQGYLPEPAAEDIPGEGGFLEGRLRRRIDPEGRVRCVHTVKRGEGLVRTEVERELDEETFAALWPRTDGRRLTKTRYLVREGERVFEVDVFDDFDLVLCEVELPSPDAEVVFPSWLASHVVRELTEDPRYRNYALATEGLPPDHALD